MFSLLLPWPCKASTAGAGRFPAAGMTRYPGTCESTPLWKTNFSTVYSGFLSTETVRTCSGAGRGGRSPRQASTVRLTSTRRDFQACAVAGTSSLPAGRLRYAGGTPSQGACRGACPETRKAARAAKTIPRMNPPVLCYHCRQYTMSDQDLLAQIERLKAENESLKRPRGQVSMKV